MATWTEDEFVSRAKMLARAHAGAKTPINDLVEKVAREAELSPDSIRTLGRLTNVAVFQELFQQKAAASESDRMVEFEPGDPEVVITRVVKSAAIQDVAAPTKTASAEIPDLMRGVRGYCTDPEKVAAYDEVSERIAPKQLELMRLRKMADELAVTTKTAAMRWESGVSALSRCFNKAPGYGPSYADFEKAALAAHGMAAVPELVALREDLKLPKLEVSAEKVAHLSDKYAHEETLELRLLADSVQNREHYLTLKTACDQVLSRLRAF